jgi:hypothetical protein
MAYEIINGGVKMVNESESIEMASKNNEAAASWHQHQRRRGSKPSSCARWRRGAAGIKRNGEIMWRQHGSLENGESIENRNAAKKRNGSEKRKDVRQCKWRRKRQRQSENGSNGNNQRQ